MNYFDVLLARAKAKGSSSGGNIEFFEINPIEGTWSLDNGKTFDDVIAAVESGKYPVLYNISSRGEYLFYTPGIYSVASTDPTTTVQPIFYRTYYAVQTDTWQLAALYADVTDETKTVFVYRSRNV